MLTQLTTPCSLHITPLAPRLSTTRITCTELWDAPNNIKYVLQQRRRIPAQPSTQFHVYQQLHEIGLNEAQIVTAELIMTTSPTANIFTRRDRDWLRFPAGS